MWFTSWEHFIDNFVESWSVKANNPHTLQTIADKELVTQVIGIDLLTAEEEYKMN